ncbi:hypothetical protein Tco_0085952 [Tanacetum coccineum]
MLVQPTEDEDEGSERPSEPQPTPSPSHPSEAHVKPQSDPSPGPSPTIPIPDPIPEALEIKSLKAQVKKLKKQARPFILHHKAWLRTVKRKNQNKKKVLKTSKRRSVFKQGRKTVKSSKGAPTVPTNTEWDDLDMDIDDTMDYTLAQDKGNTDKVNEKGESTAQQQSTDRQDEGTDMPKVSTARTKLSTDKVEEGTAEPEPRESTSSAAQTTPTPTPTTFGDDETIAQVLLNMSQAKAVSKEKEKGVEIRNAENAERPRTTSTRSVLTLKPLPKIDPNDKGKKRIEEDEESDTESEEITEAKKKFDQIAHDEEVARKMQEEWEAEEERKRLTEEEATKTALSNEYDFIQARIEADRLLAERVQEAEREQFTVEERAKFLHDTIATQRRILAQQRSEAIRNKPPTKNQFRNQMMTYLKHVGNKKHADLKTKSFDEIKALYEKVKRFDDSFITIGSTEDERKIKEMNEGASDPDKKKKIVKEDVSAKVPAKQDVAEQGTKKRKGGHMKMIARKRKRPQPDVDSDDEHRKCLKIVTFEGTIDSEIMETKSFISKLDKVSSPEGDYLVVYRVNGNFRAFNYLMEVLHIFDRQDLFHLYDLVMKQYSESTPEGIELILWGDLKIMMESSIEVTDQGDFWNDQQDWEIVTWRLYEACGVCILEFKDGTVIHMLVERKYPLSKELLQRMLDFGLEVEVESTAALDLIRVLNSPCFIVKSWLVQDQKGLERLLKVVDSDSLLKTIWFIYAFLVMSMKHLDCPKANGSRPNWLFDIDALTNSMNYKPVVAGNQSNGNAGTKACVDAGLTLEWRTSTGQSYYVPLWTEIHEFSSSLKDSPDARFKPSGEEEKKDAEDLGNEGGNPSEEGERVDQEKDANVNNTNNINTVSPTVNVAGIVDNVVVENIVYGCANDPSMPELEEIGRFSDVEDDISRADINNLDTYFQVSHVPTTRIHKDHPIE